MLVSLNEKETGINGCHCLCDVVVHMQKVYWPYSVRRWMHVLQYSFIRAGYPSGARLDKGLINSEFKIRRRRKKRRLKSDFSTYETVTRLSQLGHYVLCRRTLLELSS